MRLSPYIPEKWLNLVIDGSATRGVGYVLFQWVEEEDPPIEGEMAALQFAVKSAHYYLLHCPRLRLFSDCSGLVQMMGKDNTHKKYQAH